MLNAGGRAIIYGDGNYRMVVKDRLGNLIYDGLSSAFGSGGASQIGDGTAVGTVLPWSGLVAPTRYVFAYGQELSRSTYTQLYSAITLSTTVNCISTSNILTGISDTTQIPIGAPVEASCVAAGTTVTAKAASTVTVSNNASVTISATARFFPWSNGNGTTTFNVPDLRGRVLPGRDNMGGTAAARLTTAIYGAANPDAIGASGGAQTQTLITGNLPAYSPAGTIGSFNTHTHTVAITTAGATISAGATPIVIPGGSTITSNNSAITATFTGTAQGGASTPFSVVQPSITLNYIIKILPDTNISTLNVVTSLGGMTGDITCSGVIVCSGQNISAAGLGTGDVVGPSSATVGHVAVFNNVSGKLIADGQTIVPILPAFSISGVADISLSSALSALNTAGGGALAYRTVNGSSQINLPTTLVLDLIGPNLTTAIVTEDPSGSPTRAQRLSQGYLAGPHVTTQNSLQQFSMVAEGSGANNPGIDATITMSSVKKGWPTSPNNGEIDTLILYSRNSGPGTTNDQLNILGSVDGIQGRGFNAFFEAVVNEIDSGTFLPVSTVHTYSGVLNSRDGFTAGHVVSADLGVLNTGYLAKTIGTTAYFTSAFRSDYNSIDNFTVDNRTGAVGIGVNSLANISGGDLLTVYASSATGNAHGKFTNDAHFLQLGVFSASPTIDTDSSLTISAASGTLFNSGGIILAGGAAPTVAAAQIGFGSTTAVVANCGGAATACLVINVAGTIRYIPFY